MRGARRERGEGGGRGVRREEQGARGRSKRRERGKQGERRSWGEGGRCLDALGTERDAMYLDSHLCSSLLEAHL